MNLEELQSVRDRERQIDKLQQLRESFYADAGEFIQQLRAERERAAERADSPFDSPEVGHLTDEIETAEQTVEAIYEKRVGKIVKNASLAAADLPAETDGLTAEEQELFDTLVEDITANRERVVDVLSGEASEDRSGDSLDEPSRGGVETGEADRASAADVTSGDDNISAADVMGSDDDITAADVTGSDDVPAANVVGGGQSGRTHDSQPERRGEPEAVAGVEETSATTEEAESKSTGPPVRKDGGTQSGAGRGEPAGGSRIDRERVRITGDVDPFVGLDDRDYDLDTDDVVTLPATNAELLVEQDVAEPID